MSPSVDSDPRVYESQLVREVIKGLDFGQSKLISQCNGRPNAKCNSQSN